MYWYDFPVTDCVMVYKSRAYPVLFRRFPGAMINTKWHPAAEAANSFGDPVSGGSPELSVGSNAGSRNFQRRRSF